MTNAQRRTIKNDLESPDRLEQKLTDLGQFHTRYNDSEHLERHFRDQLTLKKLLK